MAVAQSDIPRLDITEGQIEPIPVAIADFGPDGKPSAVGKQISQIISDDLVSSGLFLEQLTVLPLSARLNLRKSDLILQIERPWAQKDFPDRQCI